MVQKSETLVTLIDDLDGSKAERTVAFTYDGVAYEIELSRKNAAAFAKAVGPYVDAGRRVRAGAGAGTGRRGAASGGRRRGAGNNVGAVREWANANGFSVSERGRISQEVRDAYDAAH